MIPGIAVEGDNYCFSVSRVLPRIENIRVKGSQIKFPGKDAVGSNPIEHHVKRESKTARTGFHGEACETIDCIAMAKGCVQPRHVTWKEDAAPMSRFERRRHQDRVE